MTWNINDCKYQSLSLKSEHHDKDDRILYIVSDSKAYAQR